MASLVTQVVGFLPDYYVDYERASGKRSMARAGFEVKAQDVPDDIGLLVRLAEAGKIILTPPQDYDDSYCISYAKAHGGCIVTNDIYRDHVAKVR